MTIIVGRQGILGDLAGEIARLENLLCDLRRLAEGRLPSSDSLAMAPLIDGWAEAVRTVTCLIGRMHGHPTCRGSLSVTTDVWVWAPELGWARTMSRFYRLGRPQGAGRHQ